MPERKAGVTDYSKWDNIELSDDESDCHPNIEKGTWFRLKHEKRLQREAEEAEERKKLNETIEKANETLKTGSDEEKKTAQKEIDEAEARLAKMEKNKKWNVDNICKVKEERTIVNHEAESGSHSDGYTVPPQTEKDKSFMKDGHVGEGDKVTSYQDYCDKHMDLLKQYSTCKTMEKSRDMLLENCNILLQEHASWYLLLTCLEAEMAGDRNLMKLIARQSQYVSSITELAKTERRHPGNIIAPFFDKLSDPKRFTVFIEGVEAFAQRIVERAVAKREEQKLGLPPGGDAFDEGQIVEAHGLKSAAHVNGQRGEVLGRQKTGRIGVRFEDGVERALKEENLRPVSLEERRKELEEQEAAEKAAKEKQENDPDYCWWLPNGMPKEDRLGPGGEDPIEVFKNFPDCMKKAFRSREVDALKEAIAQLEPEVAEEHLRLAAKSGIWNTDGGAQANEEANAKKKPAL
eukprot:TRINITY_DN595_c3_g1_i1.p1 TRINITY_DN595_c3_g1~~TRINITY_DN595_c3_g1_i1.p1  ORF type:complete len:481 (+),score=147.25 TRINITY_DN595_c3_g1_i1:60-1445(+)